jgi:hypothetical protein
LGYWDDLIDRLPRREVKNSLSGSEYDVVVLYGLMRRMGDLFEAGGGGPPSIHEEPNEGENRYNVALEQARADFICDVATAFGFRIKTMEPKT